jgi:hypothetical protein
LKLSTEIEKLLFPLPLLFSSNFLTFDEKTYLLSPSLLFSFSFQSFTSGLKNKYPEKT